MKKIMISLLSITMLILFWCATAYASKLEATIAVTQNNTEVKTGETVTITLKLTNLLYKIKKKLYVYSRYLSVDAA